MGGPREKPPGTPASKTWLVLHVASAGLEPTPDTAVNQEIDAPRLVINHLKRVRVVGIATLQGTQNLLHPLGREVVVTKNGRRNKNEYKDNMENTSNLDR